MAQLYQTEAVKGGLEPVVGAKAHRVIEDVRFLAKPGAVYKTITESPGWPYRVNKERYLKRDRAFVAVIYVGCLRTSEVCTYTNHKKGEEHEEHFTLMRDQLKFEPESGGYILEGVRLVKAKTRRNGVEIPRKHTHRDTVYLPMDGERRPFTDLILEWAEEVAEGQPMFKFKRVRAWQIVRALTGQWNHYFRMLGENYLYRAWGKNIADLADYLQVDKRTLLGYLRGDYSDKPRV